MRRVLGTARRDDSGFGLIEAVVALLIAGVVFGALATSLIGAVQASLFGRQNQQATDFMTRELERLRSFGYGSLEHTAADLAGDPRLEVCGTDLCLRVDGVAEPLVSAVAGGVSSHIQVLAAAESNDTSFTVSSYVTEVPDQPVDQARRATVFVTWQSRGSVHTRSTSSIIAYTQRGLPLPVFRLEMPVSTLTINPGARITYALSLANQGAPDRWNLAITGAGAGWDLYADTDGDGALDPMVDAALTDTTGDGAVDTGRLDPSTTIRFFLSRATSAGEPLGTTTTTVTATSVGQPLATGGQKSVIATTEVTGGPVTPTPSPTTPPTSSETVCAAPTIPAAPTGGGGYTVRSYTLQNGGIGDSTLQNQLYLGTAAGDEPTLARYSTNITPTTTGRVLGAVPAASAAGATVLAASDPTTYADWVLQAGSKTWVDGAAVLRLWVARADAGASPVDLKAVLYAGTSSGSGITRTLLAEAQVSLSPFSCTGFQEVYVTLPAVSSKVIAKNAWFGVRVVTVGTDAMRLAYDVPTQFAASLTMRVK